MTQLITTMRILTDLDFVVTEERRAAEAKRMNESSKRRLILGLQGKKKKSRQPEEVLASSGGVDLEDQTITDRLRQLNAGSAQVGATTVEGTSSKVAGKRPITVDLDADLAPKRGRQIEPARAIFAA
ncbi:unnamed protein product [Prunus armeniaca]